MKTLLLKLKGPMQSWGTSSRFETRASDYYPSKSAIIGLIAAGFGYKRDEDEKIQNLNMLDFAVRVDQEGTLLKDYHIATKYKPNGDFERNYVTNRYYMEDAVFIVAISHENDNWIDEIEYALCHPYFQTFMGRRSCPPPADFIIKKTNMGAIDSLKALPWQAAEWYKKRHLSYKADIYADKDLILSASSIIRNDRVVSFSQKERKFGPRFESRTSISISSDNSLDFYESI